MSFAGWLIMNRWLTIPEAPALHVLWHDGDDAGAIKRAIKAREYVVAEERAGRNVLVRAAETFSTEPWRAEMVENCRIGNGRFDPRQVNFRKKFEMRDHDHLRG